jgi:hypothetical protein
VQPTSNPRADEPNRRSRSAALLRLSATSSAPPSRRYRAPPMVRLGLFAVLIESHSCSMRVGRRNRSWVRDHAVMPKRLLATAAVALILLTSGCGRADSALPFTGGQRFIPESADVVHPALSATAAWVAYATQADASISHRHVPVGTTSKLGLFIASPGRQQVAYLYLTTSSGPSYTTMGEPDSGPCTDWTTLNPNTGRFIESSSFGGCPPSLFKPYRLPTK